MSFLSEVRALEEEGKLHKNLVFRVRLLFVISALIGLISLYNIIVHGAAFTVAFLLAALGYAAGFFLFGKMNPVRWDEKERVVTTGRLDAAGIIVLVSYILFELAVRKVIMNFFPLETTAYILATVFGVLLGRATGTVFEIHRVYKATRKP